MMNKTWMKRLAVLTGTAAMGAMGTVTAFAADAASEEAGGGIMALISTFAFPILLLVFLYFIMIRPQQKADKEAREMLKNIQIGDEVVTIGGIVGFVLKIEENTETVVLETGGDRLKIRMKRDAIKEDVTLREAMEAEKNAKKKAKGLPKSE